MRLQVGQLLGGALDGALEVRHRPVAQRRRAVEVTAALEALGLGATFLEFVLGALDALDGLLLGLPASGHLVGLLLEVGALGLELGEALLRRRVGLVGERHGLDVELTQPANGHVEFGGHRVDLDAQARRGLVHQVDRLVGQEPVRDVALRERRGRDQRGVLDAHAVMDLVALFESPQDRHRVGH